MVTFLRQSGELPIDFSDNHAGLPAVSDKFRFCAQTAWARLGAQSGGTGESGGNARILAPEGVQVKGGTRIVDTCYENRTGEQRPALTNRAGPGKVPGAGLGMTKRFSTPPFSSLAHWTWEIHPVETGKSVAVTGTSIPGCTGSFTSRREGRLRLHEKNRRRAQVLWRAAAPLTALDPLPEQQQFLDRVTPPATEAG